MLLNDEESLRGAGKLGLLGINAMIGVSKTVYAVGRYDYALQICRSILALQVKVLGQEHTATLATRNALASCTEDMRAKGFNS